MSVKSSVDSDPTMSAIRSILHDSEPTNVVPELKPQGSNDPAVPLQTVDNSMAKRPKVVLSAVKDKNHAQKENRSADENKSKKRILLSRLKMPQKIKRKYVIWASLALIAVIRPLWLFTPFLLTLFAFLGAIVLFGAGRTWRAVMRVFKLFVRQSPEKAHRFAKRMDRVALRWDGFLDRFPEGSVDGLYLPDFQSIQDVEKQHDVAVDARLSRMQAEG